jgi:transposase-like protein
MDTNIRYLKSKKNVLFERNSTKCFLCKSELTRIKRGFFVKKFLFWLPLKRYICYKCNRKFYSYR